MTSSTPERRRLLAQLLAAKGITARAPAGLPHWHGPGAPPLSQNQLRLWYLDRLEPGTSLYNDCVALRLRGAPLDLEAFGRAFDEVVRRHDALRTGFPLAGTAPVQQIEPDLRIPLDIVDLRALPAANRKSAAAARLREDVRAPFTLAQPPLVRATMLRCAEDDHVLGLTMHHIMSDGQSYGVIYAELSELYAAFRAGRAPMLPDLRTTFGDYAAWEHARVTPAIIERNLAYWRERLRGPLPSLALPADNPRSAAAAQRGAFYRFALPSSLLRALGELCHREQTTSYQVLLSAYTALLHHHTGQEDILIGTPSSCRTHPDLDALVGFFVRTVVLRLDLTNNPKFRDLLRRVRTTALEAARHEEVPFDRIVQEVRPEAASAQMPLIQAWFTHMRDMIPPMRIDGMRTSCEIVDPGNARFELALILDETDRGVAAYFEYDVDRFAPARIARMADDYLGVLHQCLGHPETSLQRLRESLRTRERARRGGSAPPRVAAGRKKSRRR